MSIRAEISDAEIGAVCDFANVMPDRPRYDPVFPGRSRLLDPSVRKGYYSVLAYTNEDDWPSMVGCVDNTYICSRMGACWDYPDWPAFSRQHPATPMSRAYRYLGGPGPEKGTLERLRQS